MQLATPSAGDLQSVDEHLAEISAAITPLAPRELEPGRRGGRHAWPRTSPRRYALPPFDNSAMDGYAVLAADVAGASAERAGHAAGGRRGRGRRHAGEHRLEPGRCLRIMTGAPLPAGADAVVPVEWTERRRRPGGDPPRAVDAGRRRIRRAGERRHGRATSADRAGPGSGPRSSACSRRPGTRTVPARPRPRVVVHLDRQRAGRAGHAAGPRPDLGVQQLHAGRGRPRRPAASAYRPGAVADDGRASWP